ncbi:MAG TPA: flavin reductase family protein [Saprospiraceae bacterium]|nr:flavin reductase family protein [Saprospiraceae bacterium]
MSKQYIDPKEIATKDLHQFIIGGIAPRPIAFVSTVDEYGRENLAPYSFFNAFSSNPPILVFSSNRKVSDNTTKDTLHNIEMTKEAVINVVNYPIVRQMALASVEFPRGISEFEKTGLSTEPSTVVKPPRVKESPMNFECRVKEIITLGDKGGAGHLIICEVVGIHIDSNVLTNGRIDPQKIDLMGRMGRMYYVRASGDAVMEIVQMVNAQPIGYDKLPGHIKRSDILTGNDIGILAAAECEIPVTSATPEDTQIEELHKMIKTSLTEGNVSEAIRLAFNGA